MIEKIKVGKLSTNCYVLVDEQTNKCAIVDPGFNFEKIIEHICSKKYDVEYILLTHGHFDHAFEAQKVKDYFNTKVVIHKNGKEVLEDEKQNLSISFLKKKLELNADIFLEDGQEIVLGQMIIRLIYIGGHTIDSSCYYVEKENILISGDNLFFHAVGRTDLYMSDEKRQIKNINEKLFILPNDVVVYPGHGISTTIGEEKNNTI